jgi:hypothetical protein
MGHLDHLFGPRPEKLWPLVASLFRTRARAGRHGPKVPKAPVPEFDDRLVLAEGAEEDLHRGSLPLAWLAPCPTY